MISTMKVATCGSTVVVSVDSRSAPSPKRARVENSSSMEHGDSSTGDVGGGCWINPALLLLRSVHAPVL
jgi:hypothetical protein